MKQLLVSFLFFLCYSHGFCELPLISEKRQDSLLYYYQLANNPKTSSSLTKAFLFFNNEIVKNTAQKDTVALVNNLRQVSIIQSRLGDYHGSETTAVKALTLLESQKQNDYTIESKVGIYNQLGKLYAELLDYDTAMRYYSKGLGIAEKQEHVNIIKNNMAVVHLEQLHYQQAKKEFLEIYSRSLSLNDLKQTARALDNLGHVEYKLHEPEALEHLTEALGMRLSVQDHDGLYGSYKNLSAYYKGHDDLDKALFYANKAYETANVLNSASYLEDALSLLVSLSPDARVLEYKTLRDSLDRAKQLAENKYALIKYNYYQQEQIANENKIQKEKERGNRILYQSLGLLLLVSSVLLYALLKSKHRKDKIQVVYNTEARISKKVHDEVANDMYHAMTKLENNAHNKEELLNDLEKIYLKTRDISKGIGEIDVYTNFHEVLYDLLISYQSDTVSVITRNLNHIDWGTIDPLKKETIYRVLQELMTNMRKHSKATNVLVSFNQVKNTITILYKDNGMGCDLKKSGGLLNTENRMASIKGSITFESDINKGFKAQISI